MNDNNNYWVLMQKRFFFYMPTTPYPCHDEFDAQWASPRDEWTEERNKILSAHTHTANELIAKRHRCIGHFDSIDSFGACFSILMNSLYTSSPFYIAWQFFFHSSCMSSAAVAEDRLLFIQEKQKWITILVLSSTATMTIIIILYRVPNCCWQIRSMFGNICNSFRSWSKCRSRIPTRIRAEIFCWRDFQKWTGHVLLVSVDTYKAEVANNNTKCSFSQFVSLSQLDNHDGFVSESFFEKRWMYYGESDHYHWCNGEDTVFHVQWRHLCADVQLSLISFVNPFYTYDYLVKSIGLTIKDSFVL